MADSQELSAELIATNPSVLTDAQAALFAAVQYKTFFPQGSEYRPISQIADELYQWLKGKSDA